MTSPIDYAVAQQAAEWFALLRSDAVSDADRVRWQEWIVAQPEHRGAWQRVEAIGRQFERLPSVPSHAALDAHGRGRRRAMQSLVFLCATGAVGWGGARTLPWRAWSSDYRTVIGEVREITLLEGTQLWLNTASAADIDYGRDLRRIALRSGEVLIETAADTQRPARPLVVDTAQGRLLALGTRFSVRQNAGETHVSLFEGALEIQDRSGQRIGALQAGQQLRFSDQAIDAPEPVDPGRQTWARGMLLADNQRLGDFIEALSRYRHGYLACAPDVADLRLVGAYPLADTDRILATLQSTMPVRVREILPWWVVVEAR